MAELTKALCKVFLSTPSARRATSLVVVGELEGGISIHALREEGDIWKGLLVMSVQTFLSTPSARRATSRGRRRSSAVTYFYPRPPRGGRLDIFLVVGLAEVISIHALREEGDSASIIRPSTGSYFYPRPPRGGRPRGPGFLLSAKFISIHALREEGDRKCSFQQPKQNDFYPRPPRGGRPEALTVEEAAEDISIHALREEGDHESCRVRRP